jgi:5-methyltetrahydrofolate--homocysteine methyltransferase
MNIDFSIQRWDTIKQNYRRWWAGDLDRPLIHATLHGRTPHRGKPDIPWHYFNSFYDLSVPVEKIVDWYEYNLEQDVFLGDSFPHAIPNFGPGVVAAYIGAEVTNSESAGTTWFHPGNVVSTNETRLRFDKNSPWWRRTVDLCRAAQERFQGLVQMDMTDLGGNLDIAATFRPSENLLFDLYDCPDEVIRLAWEGHAAWWHCFEEISRLTHLNPGYTTWCPIFSEEPSYMLQCDFCYMIGPEQFEKFVLPELAASCRKLTNPFYHLDGPGQLPHLDLLLSIPELKGIQWVPGAGQPDITKWPDVYRKIRASGKRIQFYAGHGGHGWNDIDIIADQLGSGKGLIMIGNGNIEEEDKVHRLLDKYGCADNESPV